MVILEVVKLKSFHMNSILSTIEKLGILALKIIVFLIVARVLFKILNWI